jgi:hypothetical protein
MAGKPTSHLWYVVPVLNQIRTYWWCNAPNIGRQRMYPAAARKGDILKEVSLTPVDFSLVVVHLRKKVATPFGCHIKQTPQGVGQIPSAMVLIGNGWRETHLRAPK